MRIQEKAAWTLAAALALFVVAAISGVARGGSLEPPGPVGSTMKTLEEIPGSWSRSLGTGGADVCNTQRFRCVFGGTAVLDHETGIVWEQAQTFTETTWAQAARDCQLAATGSRRGWRLPSVEELMTLIDLSAPGNFPSNHPFDADPGSAVFWSSTQSNFGTGEAYVLNYNNAGVFTAPKNFQRARWCVRAPEGGHEAVAFEADPPSWHQKLNTVFGAIDPCVSERFQCVMSGGAVLDRETGLVWQRFPSTAEYLWRDGIGACLASPLNDRYGWRLPTIEELSSLFVPSAGGLPPNHPFIASGLYWTATTVPFDPTRAYAMFASTAGIGEVEKDTTILQVWCVRGGYGYIGTAP